MLAYRFELKVIPGPKWITARRGDREVHCRNTSDTRHTTLQKTACVPEGPWDRWRRSPLPCAVYTAKSCAVLFCSKQRRSHIVCWCHVGQPSLMQEANNSLLKDLVTSPFVIATHLFLWSGFYVGLLNSLSNEVKKMWIRKQRCTKDSFTLSRLPQHS